MWNILFVGFVLYVSISNGDVSHLGSSHPGYPIHKPDHPLELPGEGTTETVAGYPKVIPNNPLQIPDASTGNVRNQFPDTQFQGTSTGGVSIQQQQNHPSHHDNHDHHYHGQDGKYNHHDDGRGWDIRKSVPGEPGQDYPTYDSVPSTSFTCKEKVPGYYADEDTRCQVFRICTTNSLKTHNSFLCPNGSLFSQEFLTCDWWMNVDCASSSNFHYKNKDIGKMPTGSQLMYQVSKMLEAPNNNPYFFTKQQEQQVRDQTIADNQIQGTGSVHDVYLPVKQPVVTTTKKYYTPTVPATTTTTSTTTPKPTISISNLHKIKTSEEKLNINQQSLQNVVNREQEENIRQQSLQNVQKQYIPPPVPTIEQSRLSNVKTEQNKIKVGDKNNQLHVSQILKTSPELHVSRTAEPTLHLSKQNTVINNPQPLTISQPKDNQKNQLFVSQTAQKQQEGNLFISPSRTTEPTLHLSKQNTVINNTQPLTISQPKDNEKNQLFVSQTAQKQQEGNLFISPRLPSTKPSQTDGLPFANKPFVSQVAKKGPSDGQLFTSQLKPVSNAQPLFVSPVAMKENKLFTSPERPVAMTTTNNKTVFLSSSIPPVPKPSKPTQNMDQLFLSQIDQSTASGFKGYDYQKQVPSLTTDQQVTNQQNPSLTVTKEQSHTVTHSEKTTHVFQNTEEGPQKISLLDNAQNTAQHLPSGNVAQIDRKEQQISSGVNQFTSSGVQQQGGLQQQIGGSQFTASRNQQEGGLQKQTGVQQQQIGDNQFTLSGVQQQSGVKHFTTSAVQQQGGLQQQTGGSQLDFSGIKQQAGVLQQGEVPQQTGGNQFDFSGINQFTTSGNTQQQQGGIVQQQQLQKVAPGSNLDITKDQAFQQIDNIQSGIQQLSQEQDNIQKFGVGILNPRDGPTIPAPNFGKNIQHSQFNSFQNIPQEFTYQGVQPNYFEEQSYNQNQGYQFQQPNYHEVTGQNFNYHGANRGDNFNFEVQKGGSAQNYNGERLSQHSNGHSHSAYSGHNVEYKESTKVDIVPSLGFHLNDDFEKDRFISAVLGGLIQDGPHYHSSTSANIDQQQFSPSDARFSSYQGPSSYLVPQASVQRLPSDSGYYR